MDLKNTFSAFKDTVASKSKEVAQKAKDMADVASLNSQIKAENDAIRKACEEIGQQIFEADKEDPDNSNFKNEVSSILRHKAKIVELEKEKSQIKGVKICPACGKEMPYENSHCGNCGAEYVEPEAPEVEKVCPGCGEPVAEGDTICVKCGRAL